MRTTNSLVNFLPHICFWATQSKVYAECIPLENSTKCAGFRRSLIDSNLADYTFLSDVTGVKDFDIALQAYINDEFPALKFRDQYGCPAFQQDSSRYYAR